MVRSFFDHSSHRNACEQSRLLKLTLGAALAGDSASEGWEVVLIEDRSSFASTTIAATASAFTLAWSLGSTLTEISVVVILLEAESEKLSTFTSGNSMSVFSSELAIQHLGTDLRVLVFFKILFGLLFMLSALSLWEIRSLLLSFIVSKSESNFFFIFLRDLRLLLLFSTTLAPFTVIWLLVFAFFTFGFFLWCTIVFFGVLVSVITPSST